ncbi:MAG: hypothetical protein D6732_28800 [Methanobacteriota archaeon]|nr:MAG: hypothetical protein D6732_28800 [Euryarchaeota archaeon]
MKDPDKYDYIAYPELSWLNTDVLLWGDVNVSSPEDYVPLYEGGYSPVGPSTNPGWNDIGDNSLYSNYTKRPEGIQVY